MFKIVPPTALQKFALTSSGYRQKSAQTTETEELKESMKQCKTAHGQRYGLKQNGTPWWKTGKSSTGKICPPLVHRNCQYSAQQEQEKRVEVLKDLGLKLKCPKSNVNQMLCPGNIRLSVSACSGLHTALFGDKLAASQHLYLPLNTKD